MAKNPTAMLEAPDNRDERILILTPTGRDAAMTARFLTEAGLPSKVCGDIQELCREILIGSGLGFLTGEALTPNALSVWSKRSPNSPHGRTFRSSS